MRRHAYCRKKLALPGVACPFYVGNSGSTRKPLAGLARRIACGPEMGGALVGNGDGEDTLDAKRKELHLAGAETLPPPTSPAIPILRSLDEPRYPEPPVSVSGVGKELIPTDRAVGTAHRALGFASPPPDVDAPGH